VTSEQLLTDLLDGLADDAETFAILHRQLTLPHYGYGPRLPVEDVVEGLQELERRGWIAVSGPDADYTADRDAGWQRDIAKYKEWLAANPDPDGANHCSWVGEWFRLTPDGDRERQSRLGPDDTTPPRVTVAD
jgi:hypothetical protein